MFPQDRLGAGAFTVLFKNTNENEDEQKEVDLNAISSLYIYQNLKKSS
jgi:hypothetical protein